VTVGWKLLLAKASMWRGYPKFSGLCSIGAGALWRFLCLLSHIDLSLIEYEFLTEAGEN
jgi:hypothetical protein